MYLSKLEIIGFKSFAQKVQLTFDSGISGIVGPNGCGKSNIVDSIRWVLGEQRYSTLRSEKMEDVIFNGTKNRKSLGMAEASLVIENTKGILPSEYTQVTVGRRVYRSGESEYLLNKVPCRLKDILDLFMDTGMGSDAYSVIELKMVETILSDKTDERRRLFEEASGVTKYKHRRKAAYRKLESVQADLVRVNDIVAEVQKAVNTLERQAKKASQYNEVRDGLRKLEIDLMEREYAQLFERMEPLEASLAELRADRTQIDGDLGIGEQKIDQLRARALEVEQRLTQSQRDIQVQLDKVHQEEQGLLVADEQIKGLTTGSARFEREKEDYQSEIQGLEATQETLRGQIAELARKEEEISSQLVRASDQLLTHETARETVRSKARELNEHNLALINGVADLQASIDRKREHAQALQARGDRYREEAEGYRQELVRLQQEIDEKTAEDGQLRRRFSEAEVNFFKAESSKKEVEKRILDLQRQESELRLEAENYVARIAFLRDLFHSQEGLPEGIRYLSSHEQWKTSRDLTIADAINAEDRYRPALEAALGELAGVVVVRTTADAEKGIHLLTEGDKGKVTFVCLDQLPVFRSRRLAVNTKGVYGWASDLATYDPEYGQLFHLLLDRTLIVDNIRVAKEVTRQISGVRCITLNGEVVSGSGVVRGGSKKVGEGGSLGKRKQIEELEEATRKVTDRSQEVRASLAAAQNELEAIDLRSLGETVKVVEKEMNGVEISIAQLQFEKKRVSDIIERNTGEQARLLDEFTQLEKEIAAAHPELDARRAERSSVEERIRATAVNVQNIEGEWSVQAAAVKDLDIALVRTRGQRQTAENDLHRASERMTTVRDLIKRRAADIQTAREDIASVEARRKDQAQTVSALRSELHAREEQRSTVEQEAARIRDEIHQSELRIKDERRSHDDMLQKVHETELKLSDLTAKAEHIRSLAERDFEMRITRKTYPDEEFVDFAALRDEIQAFRDKLKSLGNVNFAAFEEYQGEKQRLEFLTGQRNDLLEAEKTLLQTIEEINATAQKKFLDTFDLIRRNFIETFKSLFDAGDECDLLLEEGVDPLEAAVDIIAKPRGKRPTSIHLLSGGEKTLTAIALLFAIYLVKPSPFCILDEVDAPLDDANIDRFTRILKKFSDNTQFIVVTHNKRTMEAAKTLYGVTMEEEGVSKIVTVKFNKDAQVSSAAVVSE